MVKVLLFAHLQEQVGQAEIQIDLEHPLTVEAFKQLLEEQYSLHQINNVMIAVNEEYAKDDDMINSDDTIALIPPVSGG
ncbi:molybdopterin converting factor subunit 1 [Bacillaceae bacterium W0354]